MDRCRIRAAWSSFLLGPPRHHRQALLHLIPPAQRRYFTQLYTLPLPILLVFSSLSISKLLTFAHFQTSKSSQRGCPRLARPTSWPLNDRNVEPRLPRPPPTGIPHHYRFLFLLQLCPCPPRFVFHTSSSTHRSFSTAHDTLHRPRALPCCSDQFPLDWTRYNRCSRRVAGKKTAQKYRASVRRATAALGWRV